MPLPIPKKHWTPAYLRARLRQMLWQKMHPLDPWLTRDAVEFLHGWIQPEDTLVEFGSGRSTIWFARLMSKGFVISVEHHEAWYRDVSGRIKNSGLRNVSYHWAEERADSYVGSADRALCEKGGVANIILVDGRLRDHCALWALKHIRAGGLIVIDNIQRYLPHKSKSPTAIGAGGEPATALWKEFAENTSSWRQYWTSDDVEDTAFFFAPIAQSSLHAAPAAPKVPSPQPL